MAKSIAEDFDPSGLSSAGPPIFVRKVSRRRHWRGEDGMTLDERIHHAAAEVFTNDDGRVSVFKVENADDFYRVAIGLNSGRGSLKEQLEILGITPGDIEASGLALEQTPGDTDCLHANARHYDIIHDDAAIERLVRRLVDQGRLDHRYKKQMERAAQSALAIGCRATESTLPQCQCEI
ncbi:MAG: hypothetical protein JJU33_05155 [Phycisphaerales bacterium]|nr:hypothetical protein [Phycisphaerales bacterium]